MGDAFSATSPPIHPDDLGPPPGSILLGSFGYISDRTNASTAEGLSRTKKRIQVTFWAAHPPRASYFTVYSPDLEPSAAFKSAPKLVNTEDDLVMIRVPICDAETGNPYPYDHFFVYQAGTEKEGPSLDLVPSLPPIYDFSDYQVGLLRRRGAPDMYLVAILTWAAQSKYNLHLYNSKTKTWSTKLMTWCLDFDSQPTSRLYKCSTKVITIGGELGSVGWVDLWRGILVCDLLLEDNCELRYIPLPSADMPKPEVPDAVVCRDIAVLQGYIKYFEMCVFRGGGWMAVEWRRKDCCKKWKKHHVIQVLVDEAEIKEQPTLKAYSGFPALSLHDAGVVYIMDRQSIRDKEARVIAVDMMEQAVKGLADYVLMYPLAYNFYRGSGISKHLRWTSSARGNAETGTNEIVQAGKEEVPTEGSNLNLEKFTEGAGSARERHGRSRKCRERRGRSRGLK